MISELMMASESNNGNDSRCGLQHGWSLALTGSTKTMGTNSYVVDRLSVYSNCQQPWSSQQIIGDMTFHAMMTDCQPGGRYTAGITAHDSHTTVNPSELVSHRSGRTEREAERLDPHTPLSKCWNTDLQFGLPNFGNIKLWPGYPTERFINETDIKQGMEWRPGAFAESFDPCLGSHDVRAQRCSAIPVSVFGASFRP